MAHSGWSRGAATPGHGAGGGPFPPLPAQGLGRIRLCRSSRGLLPRTPGVGLGPPDSRVPRRDGAACEDRVPSAGSRWREGGDRPPRRCCPTRPCRGPAPATLAVPVPPYTLALPICANWCFTQVDRLSKRSWAARHASALALWFHGRRSCPSCGIRPGPPPRPLGAVPVTVGRGRQPRPPAPLCPPAPAGPRPSSRAGPGPTWRAASARAVSAAPGLAHTPSVSTLASRARALRVGTLGSHPMSSGSPLRSSPWEGTKEVSPADPSLGCPLPARCSPNGRHRCCGSLPLSSWRWPAIVLNAELLVRRAALPRSPLSTRVRPTAKDTCV